MTCHEPICCLCFSAFVDMGKCFLRFPYEQLVTLTNPTSIPARYELIPQDRTTSRPPIQYDSPKSWVSDKPISNKYNSSYVGPAFLAQLFFEKYLIHRLILP